MSKTVDERVVEMRFDNRQFESNVKTTMSTLERLKASLKFPKSSQSLDNISKSVKNVDFSGMQRGIETVNARFSALQVVGMTALSNITSAAMRAGSSLASSFTIEPITSGFKEYELQMNSIQTILANTKSKGTSMDQVTAALNKLNEYADLTIYNFAEMTKNIGTFTAAGVDLDTSVGAIKGIANLGAMSSSTSAQVSSAMYQLSQALATGRVSLMDWNSVVNAGMGGEQFQTALKRTAENFGYDVDSMIEKYGSFRESLTQGGWLTAEILTETLNQIGGAYDENALRAKGYSEENIKAILDMAQTATEAATDVKTFTQLMDTLKEAAGSGWAQVWQSIFGDFEQAKVFFSDLHSMLEPVVIGPIDALNNVISGAMGGGESRWGEFTSQLDKAGVTIDSFQSKLSSIASSKGVNLDNLILEYGSLEKAMASGQISADMVSQALSELAVSTDDASAATKSLAEWQKVVDDVWLGTYGNIDTGRMEKLAAAGWEYAEVQKLVNMTVDGHRLTLEDLSAAQIESMGYTKEQAEALASLADEAKKSGSDINGLINDILTPKQSGRELFLEGLKNTLTAIIEPLQAIGAAFSDVFGMSSQDLYDLIKGFNEFSKSIKMNGDDLGRLRKTFKGIFSVIHTVSSLVGDTLVAAFKGVSSVLAPFSNNILRVTAFLGECVYEFDRWITSANLVQTAIDIISGAFTFATTPIRNFVNAFSSLPGVSSVISKIAKAIDDLKAYFSELLDMSPAQAFDRIRIDLTNVFNTIKNLKWEDVLNGISTFRTKVGEFFTNLVKDFQEIGPDIIEGLQNGLKDGVDGILEWIRNLASKIIEVAKAVLGIQSPSTVFFEIGKNIIEGLCNGIRYLSGQVTETLRAVIEDIKSLMSSIDWGPILAVSAAAGTFIVFYQLTDALQTFATGLKQFSAPAQSAAGVMDAVRDGIRQFTGTNTTSKGFKNFADGVKVLAEAVAILAGSVAVLSVLDTGSIIKAVIAITALSGILIGLAAALNKFSSGATVLEQLKLNTIFLSLGAAFVLLAAATAIISTVDWTGLAKAGAGLVAFGIVVAGLTYITKYAGDINGVAAVLSKIGIAFLLLAATAKILGTMQASEMQNAGIMLAAFTGVVAALIGITAIAKGVSGNIANFVGKIGIAFLLLAASAKILGTMDPSEMDAARTMLSSFTLVVSGLIAITSLAGNHINKVSDFLGKVGVAFLALAVAARLLGGMSDDQMIQAAKAIGGLTIVIAALVGITHLAPTGQIAKISATLLAMSASIAILAGVSVLLGMIDEGNLVKGIAAVGALSVMVSLMTFATRGASDVKGTMIGIAVAIGVMAASIAVLSFLDPGAVQNATVCMMGVMAIFALVAKSASNITTSLPVMITLGVVLGLMAAALFVLSGLPTESVQGSAIALSTILVALAGACKILSGIQEIAPSALAAMGVLTAVMLGLAIIFGVMSALGVEASLPNAIALSAVLLAMSAACAILGTIQQVSTSALTAIGVLTAIVAGLAIIFGLMDALDVEASIPTAIALSTMLLALAGATAILGKLGPLATAAVPAAGAMAAVLGILTGVVAAAGAIKQIPGVEWLVSEGGAFLSQIGDAIGGFVGSFVGGALEGLTDNLGGVADNLSNFMVRLTPFLIGLKMIDPSAQQSITALTTMIGTLTGAGLMDAVTSFVTGGSSLSSFAEQLVPFGEAMMEYSQAVAGIDAGAIQASATAGQALSELANSLPKEGGLAQAIFGENQDFASFGLQLVAFGTAIKMYSIAIEGINPDAIQASAVAGQALSELANSLPKEGGLAQAIFGENQDLGNFGTQLVQFGLALKMYSMAVADLDVGSIQNSVAAGQALKDLQNGLGSDGGVLAFFTGDDMNLGDFGENLSAFGEALSDYATSVAGIDFGSVNSATSAVQRLVNYVKANADADMSGIDNIEKIEDVGTAIQAYSNKVSGIDAGTVSSSITAIRNLMDAIRDMVSLDTSGIATFKSAIAELSTINLSSIVEQFSSASTQMTAAGLNFMTNFASGLRSGGSQATAAVQQVVTSTAQMVATGAQAFATGGTMISQNLARGIQTGGSLVSSAMRNVLLSSAASIRGYYSSFYSAGAYISQGLANGMQSALGRVRSAAAQLASAAATAARAAAQVKSPSRVFMKIGGYMGEGMIIGLETYQSKVYDAGYAIGDEASKGLTKAIEPLSKMSFDNMDLNPVVTPVIDLDNVKNGVKSIDSLFNLAPPIDVMTNLSSISGMMNARIQNGSIDDVVKAVNRLNTKLDNMPVNQYNVNGITYDDGTNVARAVGDLTRSIKLERRI